MGRPTGFMERSPSSSKTAQYETELCKASHGQCPRIVKSSSFLGAAGEPLAPVHVHVSSCEENAGDLETVFPMVDGGQEIVEAAAGARLVLMG